MKLDSIADNVACVLDENPILKALRVYFSENESNSLLALLPEKFKVTDVLENHLQKTKTMFFDKVDGLDDRDGEISREEYRTFLQKATKKCPEVINVEIEHMMQTFDLDGNGKLNYFEFVSMTMGIHIQK